MCRTWDAIHQEEKKGQVFVDICKDYLEYEKGILYGVFGDMDYLANRFGWENRKKASTVVAVVAYNNGFLYQKCGYLFEELQDDFKFSDSFFGTCYKYSSDAKRYLLKDVSENKYQEKWKLYTPPSLKKLIDKGVGDFDAIGYGNRRMFYP